MPELGAACLRAAVRSRTEGGEASTAGDGQLFRLDEANGHESASIRLPARRPAALSAQICPILSHFVSFLSGGWDTWLGNGTLGVALALSEQAHRGVK